MAGIFVVGSINQDYVLRLDRRPGPGETVTDAELELFPGGKGANQAVAAARLLEPDGSNRVSMLGRVGGDAAGPRLVQNLADNGVDTAHVETIRGETSGSAFITVTPDGENAIAVSPGANRRFGPDEIDAASGALREASVLVAQMEVEAGAIRRAAEIVTGAGGRVMLNLAPARELPSSLLALLDPLVVNEHEAAFLLGDENARTPEGTAEALLELGPRSAVITLGAVGAALTSPHGTAVYAASRTKPVDTTGAGDAFAGALAARLAQGYDLPDAVPYAVKAGTAAVAKPGAQGALPYPEELEELETG
ncbi:ribokinase [Rubrobacter aplysinae]|uniref:ribokinase n=1 Tax=Rubrobacter aplysinae TaxID=909625 RepID=UPI00064B9400|nr:ribokinase [Rubrobacter aplysinae]